VTTLYERVRTFGMSYRPFVGPVGSATQRPWPALDHERCSIALIFLPRAAIFTVWYVADRLPAARFSSSRVRKHRTGLPSCRAKMAAMIVYFPAPPLEPKPPPM